MPTTSAPPILIWSPGGGTPIGPVSNPPVYSQAGVLQLVAGQAYVDVVFGSIQTTSDWVLVECDVTNTADPTPLNIWTGLVTNRTTAGFRVWLNGLPDTGNYYLHWAVSGINITPSPASTYYLTGPSSGPYDVLTVHSSTFTVSLPPSTTSGPVTVTPNDGGAGGTFSPTSVVISSSSASATFTYTPAGYGTVTIGTTNSSSLLSNPAPIAFTAVAALYTLSGPSGGSIGAPSSNFTVALPAGAPVIGTVTITPNDGGGGGTFTPSTVALTTGAPSTTFTYTAASGGTKTISTTNNGGLTDPASLSYAIIVGHYRSLTIDHTKVPSTQTDFPVLIEITDATLKTIANGGHVQRSDGFDIGFSSDAGGATPLKWEIERYNPSTGELIAWVKIPSVSSSVNTVFYVRYGDPSITTDHSDKVNVWTNGFISVYHLGNGTTLSAADSEGANNGTLVNAPTAGSGLIDGNAVFNAGSSQYINLGHSSGFNVGSSCTFSAWIIVGTHGDVFIVAKDAVGARSFGFGLVTSGLLTFQNGGAGTLNSVTSLTAGPAYHVALAKSAANGVTIYVNGVFDANVADGPVPNTATDVTIGSRLYAGFEGYYNGQIDEVHFCSVERTANWIKTEFNNQSAPGTFMTLGIEV